MSAPAERQRNIPADNWPNRRIIFLAVVIALIFYAVFRLPTTLNYLLVRARDTLTLLILAIALAYFLLPLVELLERIPIKVERRLKRGAAAFLALVIFGFMVMVLLNAVVTPITQDVGKVLRTVTDWAQQEDLGGRIDAFIEQILSSLPEPYRSEAKLQIQQLEAQLSGPALGQSIRERISEWGGAFLQWQINFISSVLSSGGYLIALLIVPVFAYYFLTDATALRRGIAEHVPRDAREAYERMVTEMDEVVQGYVRSVILISVLTGVATALTLYFAGVRVFLTFGILAGVANMVPVIGAIVAVVLISAITLLQAGGGRMVIVLIVYGVIQLVTDRVIAPKIMSENAKLHPIAVIIALLVGAEFFGILGVFIAVPVLAAAKVAWLHYRAYLTHDNHYPQLNELLGGAEESDDNEVTEQPTTIEKDDKPVEPNSAGDAATDGKDSVDGDA